jgi:hypothetical protein
MDTTEGQGSGEWLDTLLAEAKIILEKSVMPSEEPSLHKVTSAEHECSQLMAAFSQSADTRFFEGVYRMTYPLCKWFAEKRLQQAGIDQDAESLISRMYGILCERLLNPGTSPLSDNPFGWCFSLLDNLIDAEVLYSTTEEGVNKSAWSRDVLCPSTAESWMRKRRLSEVERVQEHVIEAFITDEGELDSHEREVLILYYNKEMNVEAIAEKIGIAVERTREVLEMSRLKLLNAVYKKEAGYLWKDMDEEKQS